VISQAEASAVEQDVVLRIARWNRRNLLWRSFLVARLLFRTVWTIYRERNRVMRARARGEFDTRPDIEELRRVLREFRWTAVALGGLLIKLGQFLSARADLMPPEALAELADLQDEVPAERFEDIRRVIERELGARLEDTFATIEPLPTGSASLGQVHRARLKDGRVVAIKVQRPDIHELVRRDLATLRFVLEVVRRVSRTAATMMDLRGLFREFSRMVYTELDYVREGHNAERFARIFAEEPDIVAPKVIWEHTTRRVLTLEWVSGIKVTNLEGLDAAGINRDALAKRLVGTYFRQVLEFGFFHADPHPGNIFAQCTADGPRIVFVDFGMMGSMTSRMRANIRDCFVGIVRQHPGLVVSSLERLGFVGENADHDLLEQAIGMLLAQFGTMSFGELRDMDPSDVLGEVEEMLYRQPFRLPADFAFLGRMMAMLVGLATTLSPTFNFLEVATPYTKQFLYGSGISGALRLLGVESGEQLMRDVVREGVSLVRSISSLPHNMERVLERAERGDLRLIIESPHFDPELRARNGRRAATTVLNRPVPAWVPLGIAGLLALTVVMRRRQFGE
jgi:predicted unusual protein kinase regulating ubiquinone biosynthesis (AarF/ABC1/UbiB family)